MSSMNNPMFQLPNMPTRTGNPFTYSANAANQLFGFGGLGGGAGNAVGFGGPSIAQPMAASPQSTTPPASVPTPSSKSPTSGGLSFPNLTLPPTTGNPLETTGNPLGGSPKAPSPQGTASAVIAAAKSTEDLPTLVELLHEVSNLNLPPAVSAELQNVIRTKLKRLQLIEAEKGKEAQREVWAAGRARAADRASKPASRPRPAAAAPAAPAAAAPVAATLTTSQMQDPYLQALYNGDITPDEYRQLTEGGPTPIPTDRSMPATLELDRAKGAEVMPPSEVIDRAIIRRRLGMPETSLMPAAETRSFMGPTTADLYPQGDRNAPGMLDYFATYMTPDVEKWWKEVQKANMPPRS